jgi:ATP-dependent DNA helicase RecG
LIDPSDKFGFKSVKEEQKKLNEEIFPEFEVGLLHGQLKPEEKEAIMNDFKDNKLKVLVATSVVEVGVDIPNATVMIIEGAERFGLAQLHQFRGRVGRGEHQSYCFFFTDSAETRVISRLKFLANCSDGFELAEFDLKNRGAGSVFGASQSGFVESFKLADVNDLVTVKLAQGAAEEWVAQAQDRDLEKIKNRLELAGFVNHWE